VTGHFGEGGPTESNLELGGGEPLRSDDPYRKIYVARYGPDGEYRAADQYVGEADAAGLALAIDRCDELTLAGLLQGGGLTISGQELAPDRSIAPFVAGIEIP